MEGDEEFGHVGEALGTCVASFDEVGLEETCGFSLFVDHDILTRLKAIPALGVSFSHFPLQGLWMEQLIPVGDKIAAETMSCSNQTDLLLTDGSLVVEPKVALHPTVLDNIGF